MTNNIYWVGRLNVIGGVETFIYELSKMFTNYDFVIYYNYIPLEQLSRLRKYVKCVKYNGEILKCKKFFMNYDISIIDNVEAEEYIEVIHAVFKYNKLQPHTHNKITRYYAVSKEARDSFCKITGLECEVVHNPLNIETPKKVLRLISATRTDSDKGKISERMQKLVNEIEKHNIPYEWKIFSNGKQTVYGKNVIYMKPNLNVRDFVADSDYLVQLSDTEAWCYSVLESLHCNIPVIVTPIESFDEMGVKNGVNGYILDFDMKEIPIDDIYTKIPKFKYQPLKNEWENKIIKVERKYEVEIDMKVKAIIRFNDLESNVERNVGDEFTCSKERAEFLKEHNAVEILGIIPEIEKDPIAKEIEIKAVKEVKEVKEVKKDSKKRNKKKKEN